MKTVNYKSSKLKKSLYQSKIKQIETTNKAIVYTLSTKHFYHIVRHLSQKFFSAN